MPESRQREKPCISTQLNPLCTTRDPNDAPFAPRAANAATPLPRQTESHTSSVCRPVQERTLGFGRQGRPSFTRAAAPAAVVVDSRNSNQANLTPNTLVPPGASHNLPRKPQLGRPRSAAARSARGSRGVVVSVRGRRGVIRWIPSRSGGVGRWC